MNLSQKIRKYRIDKRMTLKETAKRLEIPVSTYRDWEYGRKIPAEVISKLSEVFEIPLSAFMENPSPHKKDLASAIALLEEALKIVKSFV